MKIPLLPALVAVICAGLIVPPDSGARTGAILEFANGDAMPGRLEPGEGEVVRWNSEWFETALEIDPSFLRKLTFDQPPAGERQEPFRALLRNGDVVHGELFRVGPDFIELQSVRHGRTRLITQGLRVLNRLDNPALRFSGPVSTEGWTQSGPGREESYWTGVPGGGLLSRRWGTSLYHPIILPERVAIEVKLASSRRPEFVVALQPFRGDVLRLETWDNELVLVESGSDFQRLLTLGPEDRGIHLHLFWSQKDGELSIFAGSGELLGSRKVPVPPDFARRSGFSLRNKGIDLELVRLRVAEWTGERPQLQSIEGRRIQKVDGSSVRELPVGFDGGREVLLLEGGGQLALSDLEALVFDERPTESDGQQMVRLLYADGTSVSGKLVRTHPDAIEVRTVYSPQPVRCALADLTSLEFSPRSGPEVTDTPDELRVGGQTFHGSLAGVEAGGRILWRPIGAARPVALRPGMDADVVRRKGPALTHLSADRLFLASREILSCRIDSIRDGSVSFSSTLTPVRSLPVEQLLAVEFGQRNLRLSGFGDPAWQSLEGSTADPGNLLEPDRMVLRGGGFAHPGVLRADEVHFDLEWQGDGQGAVTVGLFGLPGPDHRAPIQVSFSRWGNRIWVAASQPGGNRMIDGDDIMVQGGKLSARIELREEQLVVFVDGQELVDCVLSQEQRAGSGLRFEFGGPWFNSETALAAATISGFQVRSSNGLIRSFRIDDEVKRKALTIPRRMKEDPPTHCLVAANGDVMRGKLMEVDAAGLRFESGGEMIPFPRERVLGLVQLPEPGSGEDASEIPEAPWDTYLFLADGSALYLEMNGVDDAFLTGESPLLGACRVPLASVRQLRVGKMVALPDDLLHANWVPVPAPEPVLPGSPGEGDSGGGKGQAPDFSLPLLSGEPFQLRSARGRVVVLEFWATWCGPCRAAFGEYTEVINTFNPREVQFLAINAGEPAAVIQPYLDANRWSFPVALDAAETVKGLYGVDSIPHTVVIDREGKIVWSQSGFRPGAGRELAQIVSGLLAR